MRVVLSKKYLHFIGIYLSFFAFVLCAAVNFEIGSIISKVLMILLFGLFWFQEKETHAIDVEKSVIAVVVLLFNAFMLLRGKMQGQYVVFNTLCGIMLIVFAISFLAHNHCGLSIRRWVIDNVLVLLLILCLILLSVEVIDSWLMWDSWQYYAGGIGSIQEIIKRLDANLSGIYGLYLASHATLGYSLWIMLFQLFMEGSASVQIADITLAGISIFAFYQILRYFLGEKYSNKIMALATIPYAFSPFVLGIVGNINTDSAIMYFAIIFIACSLYHYECLELIFAFLLCFTKESAVIYYVIYILAKVVCEYCTNNRIHLLKLAKFGFGNIRNYIYALPAILWIALYKLNPNGGWGEEAASGWNNLGWNCFGINSAVVSTKLKQTVCLNFNWIFWAAIIIGIFLLCIKKVKIERETLSKLIPIGAMGVTVIVFGCLYITYVLPRYNVPAIPIIYLIAAVVVGSLNSKFFPAWNVFTSVLLLIQCFWVIDPVMSRVFPSIVIGNNEHAAVYEVGNEPRFDDHIVYNRQNIYWANTITEVLDVAEYDGNMLLVFPDTVFDAQYEMLGNWRCLWNAQQKKLEYSKEGVDLPENCTWVTFSYVSNVEATLEATDYNRILYIIPKWTDVDTAFVSDNRVVKKINKQGEVSNKGYTVQYMVMDIEYNVPLENGNYIVSPKQESSMGLCTNGEGLFFESNAVPLNVNATKGKYEFFFNEYQVALDVMGNNFDGNGTVWVYPRNYTDAQKWILEDVDDYYMLCWNGLALTYDMNDNSIRLTPRNGEDNQLWLFNE